ncbi:MAG: trypsin-like peptidase domain-containing protein [Planctomycetes bacterium]|nr:trypsin-like peptidase domain-containing protein [Planctomycetota bacterium]
MLKFLLILLLPQEDRLLERLEREIADVVRKVRPSVVSIEARTPWRPELRIEISRTLRLSGVVYRKDGYVLTDAGATAGADRIRVTLWDGRTLDAKLVGSDARSGIAVLRVDSADLVPAEIAGATDARCGSFAIAVGDSYGLKGSASIGMLAGTDRAIRVAGREYDGLLQLTTPAHPGDCGGFVADSRGRLLGMLHSVLDAEETEDFGILRFLWDRSSAGAITFAVPAETARFVADRIIKHGRMVRGWIGATVRPAAPGAEVVRVDAGGPARKAGLRKGDVILAWDGEEMRDVAALRRRIEILEEPRAAKLGILRDGTRIELEVRVELEK